MALIEAFVRNPVKVAVGVLLVLLFGLIALVRMPMQLAPEVQRPVISIATHWPGASPQEIEREIIPEQEDPLQGVEGVTKMSAQCSDSRGVITLEFEVGTNTVDVLIDGAYATDCYLAGDKIDLTLIGGGEFAKYTQDVPGLIINTPAGELVRLESLADVRLAGGPEQINRRERQRAITISVVPPREMPLELAVDLIDSHIIKPLRESGAIGGAYQIRLSGTADKLRTTWQALKWNFLLALLITYLLMAALFESWLYQIGRASCRERV